MGEMFIDMGQISLMNEVWCWIIISFGGLSGEWLIVMELGMSFKVEFVVGNGYFVDAIGQIRLKTVF